MISFKALKVQDYEVQFESVLKKSTSINEFNSALKYFDAMPAFKNAAKQLINSESEKQLSLLAELRDQIDHFKEQNLTGIEESSNALEKNFDRYNKQHEKYQTELTSLFLQHFSDYFKETHPLSRELLDDLKTRIPLQMTELGIEGNANDQLEACIQLLKTHVPLTIDFKNALEIIKNSYVVDPEISHFIFIAHEEAFLLLEKRIKNHLADMNIELIKNDYDNYQTLFSKFYRESIITLVNYYQDYKSITEDFKPKFDILKNIGQPTQDWIDDYQHLSNSAVFFSQLTPQGLKSARDKLSEFKQKINWENPIAFLQEIKNKAQAFLNNEIERLDQQFQDYQTRIDKFKHYSSGAVDISNKLSQMLNSRYRAIDEPWKKCREELANIKVIENFKDFKDHFPKEDLFDDDLLNFDELRAVLLFLEEPHPDIQNERFIQGLSSIPIENLTEKIFFILENLDNTLLPHSINNLLQFIHSEHNHPTLNHAKNCFAISLQAFFTRQPEKLAFCLAHNAPLNTIINIETYEKLINILHYTDLDKLKKWLDPDTSLRLKIKDLSTPGDSNSTKIDDALDRLISTKKILLLFETRNTPIKPDSENNTTHYSLWEACCLFKEFANNSFTPEFPYLKELEEDSENNRKVLYDYQNAVIHLDWFIKAIQQLEKQSYSPTIFLKSGKNKQKQVHQLINNLKNIPITQVDTDSINNTFEQWKKEHQLLIDEPRYRLLTKLCMLIYRQFMKLFYPASASDCSTASHQTINKLQEKFLEANLHLQKLREHFTSSVQNETATRLTFAVR